MFILFTNNEKRKFVSKLMQQYDIACQSIGRKLPSHARLKMVNNLYATLKVKRKKGLPPYVIEKI